MTFCADFSRTLMATSIDDCVRNNVGPLCTKYAKSGCKNVLSMFLNYKIDTLRVHFHDDWIVIAC